MRRAIIIGTGGIAPSHAITQQQAATEAPIAPAPRSGTDELYRLAQLHACGVLTDDDFAAAKRRLLGD